MIDHIGMSVRDIARASEFYRKALAPLGIGVVMEVSAEDTGHGAAIAGMPRLRRRRGAGNEHIHVAFAAASREMIDAFYAAAIAAGGKDNGPPGLRPRYHENYYAAFVLDADGNNIEAVCHSPASAQAATR